MSASTKYKAKKKKSELNNVYTDVPKEQPLIGKGKILLILIFGTALVAGIYIASIQMMFAPIMHIYWIIATVLLMIFMFIKMRNESIYFQITANGTPTDEQVSAHRKRTKHMKYLILALLPFLFTLFGDLVYLYLLKDLNLIDSIKNLI